MRALAGRRSGVIGGIRGVRKSWKSASGVLFDGPREQFGDIFVNYMVWRRETETRLELFAGDPWLRLNEFTRSLVVRHLWRRRALVQGSVVIVDTPSQQWSKTIDHHV